MWGAPVNGQAEIVVIGGAVVGSSIACHLAQRLGAGERVLVLEKDPSYARCATALSAGSIRQQFSTPVNVATSLYGIAFLREIGERLAVAGARPDIGLVEGGYLFLASQAGLPALAENFRVATGFGADIAWLEGGALSAAFPWLATEGVAAGTFGRSGEGWFDGYGLMQAFRAKARSLGVVYAPAEAVGLDLAGGRVAGVRLADGGRIACGAAVLAAGTGTAGLAAGAGIDLPVRSRKRFVFTFDCREALPRFPLLIDPSGVYVRPEGTGYLCGRSPAEAEDPDSVDFEVDHAWFEERIWPVLAARVPAFEAIRPGRAWAGHYDLNLFDQNAFVGVLPGFENLYIANGFSGHGLQQAPAVGRGLAELITAGRYLTLDLASLGYERYLRRAPLVEHAVV
jgi:FAD-dependent oxidoreductase domain-containing protein 1